MIYLKVLVLIAICAPVHSGHLIFQFTCQPPRGDFCVEVTKCPYFAELLENSPIPRPPNVVKLLRSHHCGFSLSMPKVCCSFSTTTTAPSTVPTPLSVVPNTTQRAPNVTTTSTSAPATETVTKQETQVKVNKRVPEVVANRFGNPFETHQNFQLLPNKICGQISMQYSDRVTNGNETGIAEFPWMALIAYISDNEIDFRCGGTAISERYVLTAAHCVTNSLYGVRLGEHNLNTPQDCDKRQYCAPKVQDFLVESVKIHPDYNSNTLANDIALIRLATKADFTAENVQPICLPFDDRNQDYLDGKFAIISGWGVTETGHRSSSLLKTSIPVLPIDDCRSVYKTFAPVSQNQICAGGQDGRDSCGGDSGGPLKHVGIIDGTPRYIQYGIVSYGPRNCGITNQPGIYTRVASYLNWILDTLKPS